MRFSYFLYAVAAAISIMAAYFSVIGWAALFSAAFIPVIILMALLELGKVACVLWLHRVWDESPKLLRGCFLVIAGVMMILTSVGIYGFLSKGHLDQEAPVAVNDIRIEIMEDRVDRATALINENRSSLDLIAQKQAEYVERGYVTRSENYRISVRDDIDRAQEAILAATNVIEATMMELAVLRESNAAAEAKLGPIKYVMEAMGSEDSGQAVRVIIYLIIFVFDPMAICMFIAAQWTHMREAGQMLPLQPVAASETPSVAIEEPTIDAEPTPEVRTVLVDQPTVAVEQVEQPEVLVKMKKHPLKMFGLN